MTRNVLRAAAVLFASCLSLRGQDNQLVPNAKLHFEFAELPVTYYSKSRHLNVPAMLNAQLPENYTPAGRFPVFVFLEGGNGGPGNSNRPREIVGPRDFITVSMPLFRDPTGEPPPLAMRFIPRAAALVNSNDAPALASSYQVMLQKLFDTVPNIAVERSAFGGFSNGAHATGALLAAKDQFIIDHFRSYCLFEGGVALALNPAALEQPGLKGSRFIALFGDHDSAPGMQVQRELITEPLLGVMTSEAAKLHLDFTRITMHGYGHETPPAYQKLLGCWIRGEKLPDIPAKP